MAERRPIYSAQGAGQQLGYIEDDEVFDRLIDHAPSTTATRVFCAI